MEQLSSSTLCLEMATSPHKNWTKTTMRFETLNSLLEFSCLSLYHLINMLNHFITVLIHALTYISMHIWYLGNHKRLKETLVST